MGGKYSFGLENNEREVQVDTIVSKYQTFDMNTPVVVVGDFNITDIYRHGSNITITQSQQNHYNNTIQTLVNAGLQKVEYNVNEAKPFTFHSWNGQSNAKILDYIFWKSTNNQILEASTLVPGPFLSNTKNSVCYEIFDDKRFVSDHNGLFVLENLFEF